MKSPILKFGGAEHGMAGRIQYIILYIGSGADSCRFSKEDRTPSLIWLGVGAIIVAYIGISYALVSAIEFGMGIGLTAMLWKSKESQDA